MRQLHDRLAHALADITAFVLIAYSVYVFYKISGLKWESIRASAYLGATRWVCGTQANEMLPHPRCIRLAKFKTAGDGSLTYYTTPFWFAVSPPYRALSYTWGPARGIAENTVQYFSTEDPGKNRPIPGNLVTALKNLSELKQDGWYWIDFFCTDVAPRAE